MPVAAVRRRKLYEEVADQLERMIEDGEYPRGDQLPSERDLMRQFGVGRPAIREALFHLRKMGLVEIRSGERARVTQPTPQFVIDALAGTARHMIAAPGGVHDFQDARVFFEVGLARHAAQHATDEDLARFEDRIGGQPPVDRRPEAVRADGRRLPLRACRDSAATRSSPPSTRRSPNGCSSSGRPRSHRGQDLKAYQAHRAIFEAVAARDPDRAEKAMRDHLDYVVRRYTDVVAGRT